MSLRRGGCRYWQAALDCACVVVVVFRCAGIDVVCGAGGKTGECVSSLPCERDYFEENRTFCSTFVPSVTAGIYTQRLCLF